MHAENDVATANTVLHSPELQHLSAWQWGLPHLEITLKKNLNVTDRTRNIQEGPSLCCHGVILFGKPVPSTVQSGSPLHTCDKFQRGIREIFLSFQWGLWKMYRIYKNIFHEHQGNLRIWGKTTTFFTVYGSDQGAPWRWGKYHMYATKKCD